MPTAAPLNLPWLVGDIGGTNARFAWIDEPTLQLQHVRTLPVIAHEGPAAAVRAYLNGLPDDLRTDAQRSPHRAALAIASPIQRDLIEMTNSHWRFSRQALQAELGLRSLKVLNDFEALALSLPGLGPQQLRAHGAAMRADATLAVIGPGTGLGVAGLVPTSAGWLALPGEGGHATLSAADDFESQLLAHVRRTHEHVSAERLLSGIGLPLLHQAVAAVWGQGGAAFTASSVGVVAMSAMSAQDVVERGRDGSDALCARTLNAFCALLGGFAGNVALTLGARGGVYIGGGIVPRLSERFFASAFRDRFEAKGRYRSHLQAIPTALITDTLAALSGAAAAISQAVRNDGA